MVKRKTMRYRKILNIHTPEITALILLRIRQTLWIYNAIMHPKDADEMANSVDHYQPAHLI